MKNLHFSILFIYIFTLLISISACKKEQILEKEEDLEVWFIEDFKPNYSVSFPDGYEGIGMYGFEGPMFMKTRTDNKVKLSYHYCHELGCELFDDTLANPFPAFVVALDLEEEEVILDNNTFIIVENDTIGLLYFNDKEFSTAVLYQKVENPLIGIHLGYYEGLSIFYNKSELSEVEEILMNIVEYE